jgi:regulatory protein
LRDARRKPAASLRATAIRMLARRDYPRAALESRLLARGGERAEVARTLDELERLGYLSDARFAQALVAQKAERFGRRAIAHALRERRIEPAVAREALSALADDDEIARAKALWVRRFRAPPADERERARQIRFLITRGFSVAIALSIVGRDGAAAEPARDFEAD